jgi:hypothetical protein
MRLHHFIWHSVRNRWHDFPADVQQELRDKGWEPPRPEFDVNGDLDLDNSSGEDFLFMHWEMIAHTNASLQAAGDLSCQQIVGWQDAPPPTDADFPVPPTYTMEHDGETVVDTSVIKSDAFFFQTPNPDGSGGSLRSRNVAETRTVGALPVGPSLSNERARSGLHLSHPSHGLP